MRKIINTTLRRTATVDSIMSRFTSTVNELRAVTEAKLTEAETCREVVRAKNKEAVEAALEADRARRCADKIEALIG